MTPENENENEEEEEDDRRASSVAMPTRVCVLLTFRVAVQIDHSMGGEVRRVEQLRGALLSVNPHAFAFVEAAALSAMRLWWLILLLVLALWLIWGFGRGA